MNAAAPALVIRTAASGDIPMLGRLIERSARALSRDHYTDAQIEAAIMHVFGVDSALIDDGTYLVAEWDGMLAECGGWSARATLFGGDRFPARSDAMLDPAVDAARIRAFFVDEGQARRGVGRTLLATCEAAAIEAGFRRATLMATLPGEPFYVTCGYRTDRASVQDCGGVAVPFVQMSKLLVAKM